MIAMSVLVAYLLLGVAVGLRLTVDLHEKTSPHTPAAYLTLFRCLFSILTAIIWPGVLVMLAWEVITDLRGDE
jgi:hypothetical protein